MNELNLKNRSLDSREVADLMDTPHAELLKKIRVHAEYLNEGNFPLVEFFSESIYLDTKGEERLCYQIARKGCELLAHKMTGAKGTQFTAKYIDRFHKMEETIKSNQPDFANLPPELQLMNALVQQMNTQALSQLKLETSIKETKEEIQEMREVIEIKPFDNWREETTKQINKICRNNSDYKEVRNKIYEALDRRAGTKIKTRLDNMKARALVAGMTRSKVDALGYLDVIAEDKKLIEIYTAIVKEMAIKKGVA